MEKGEKGEVTKSTKYRLKKLVDMLEGIKGRHTELVTVYVPAGYSLNEINTQLSQEQGTADNIKSKPVRKNVTTALDKISRHLQLYKKTPENGLALFCGNISEKEGEGLIELWALEPPEPVKTKLYWCDQKFIVDPLKDMVEEKDIYGILTLDKSEADIAILRGKKLEPLVHMESIVPGKTRAGGQSSARFSRVREGLLNDWFKQVGEANNKIFEQHTEIIGIIVGGPGPIKDMFLKEDYMHEKIRHKVIGTVDTSYTGEFGLHETIERGSELLKEAAVVKEKKLLQKFFEELQKPHGLAVHGLERVMESIEAGTVDTVVVTDKIDLKEIEYECPCGPSKKFVQDFFKNKQSCSNGHPLRILGEKDVIEALEERANNYGSKLEIVSADTREGQQFFALSGIGAFLRYRI